MRSIVKHPGTERTTPLEAVFHMPVAENEEQKTEPQAEVQPDDRAVGIANAMSQPPAVLGKTKDPAAKAPPTEGIGGSYRFRDLLVSHTSDGLTIAPAEGDAPELTEVKKFAIRASDGRALIVVVSPESAQNSNSEPQPAEPAEKAPED